MRTRARGGEERSLEVQAQDLGAVARRRAGVGYPLGGFAGALQLTRDQGRLVGAHPVAGQRAPHREDLVDRGVEEVDAGVAVDLGIDEAGDRNPRTGVRETDRDDLAVVHRDVAIDRATR